jgi:hypothetical protein
MGKDSKTKLTFRVSYSFVVSTSAAGLLALPPPLPPCPCPCCAKGSPPKNMMISGSKQCSIQCCLPSFLSKFFSWRQVFATVVHPGAAFSASSVLLHASINSTKYSPSSRSALFAHLQCAKRYLLLPPNSSYVYLVLHFPYHLPIKGSHSRLANQRFAFDVSL